MHQSFNQQNFPVSPFAFPLQLALLQPKEIVFVLGQKKIRMNTALFDRDARRSGPTITFDKTLVQNLTKGN
jgi:hypothetical protein